MTQTCGFRPGDPWWRTGKGKKFYTVIPVKGEVQFIGASLLPVCFPGNGKAQYPGVKILRFFVIGTYNGDMVYFVSLSMANTSVFSYPFAACRGLVTVHFIEKIFNVFTDQQHIPIVFPE